MDCRLFTSQKHPRVHACCVQACLSLRRKSVKVSVKRAINTDRRLACGVTHGKSVGWSLQAVTLGLGVSVTQTLIGSRDSRRLGESSRSVGSKVRQFLHDSRLFVSADAGNRDIPARAPGRRGCTPLLARPRQRFHNFLKDPRTLCQRETHPSGPLFAHMHTLISIPPSHYVERARWALDIGGISYKEQQWPPVLHWIGTFAAGAKRTVPALVLPKRGVAAIAAQPSHQAGHVLTDSADILIYVNDQLSSDSAIYPVDPGELSEVERIESLCCNKLGRYSRVLVYSGLIPNSKAVRAVLATDQQGMLQWKRCEVLISKWLQLVPKQIREFSATRTTSRRFLQHDLLRRASTTT